MKFYHVTNCNRIIQVGALALQFAPYDHVGTWMGVYATNKPDEISLLDTAADDPKSSITTLTEAEYQRCIKKKVSASNSYAPSLALSTPTPGVRQPAASAEPVDSNPNAPLVEPQAAPLDSVGAAIEVVSVQPRLKK
jgi:hypothetical protein